MKVQHLIYDLLQYRRTDADRTSAFRSMRHNDVLCPVLQRKCESILETFEKYHHITYDIQGPRDEGVDVLIRLRENELNRYVLFQVKSESDLQIRDYLEKLRGQWFRADDMYPEFDDYYIFLCCESGKNKEKIRAIEGAFAKKERTHVIEPEYALTFLRLNNMQIDAHAKSKLGKDDIVFRLALSLMEDLIPTERALLLQIIWHRLYTIKQNISEEDLAESDFLLNVYETTPNYDRGWFFEDEDHMVHPAQDDSHDDQDEDDVEFEYELRQHGFYERLSADIEHLAANFIEFDKDGKIVIDEDPVRPLIILMLDGEIRYQYSGHSLLEYMFKLFGPMRGYVDPSEILVSEFP